MAHSPLRILMPALIAGAALIGGCSGESRTHHEAASVDIVRLDKAVAQLSDTSSLDPEVEDGADAWLYVTRGISTGTLLPSTRDSLLKEERTSRAFTLFSRDVDSLLPPLYGAGVSLRRIDDFPAKVYGMVSPYSQSVIMVDTVIIIALNHYLGADYEGYASFPDYLRRNKTIERLPLDVAEAWISGRYPFPDSVSAPSLLQRMAYEGAVLATAADYLGIEDGGLLLGWNDDEWAGALANEKEAWRRIVGNEMLFSDDQMLVSRLMSPSPASVDISPDAPGRLGRFIGLRLVRASGRSPLEILQSGEYLQSSVAGPYARKTGI